MEPSLDSSIIFLGLTGSHAYGTANASSDLDIRGCCIAPLRTRLSFYRQFEQLETSEPQLHFPESWETAQSMLVKHPQASMCEHFDKFDVVIFDIGKLVRLCAEGNPNMLELLFLNDQEMLLNSSLWQILRDHRHMFLSKKVQFTFTGYAQGQLKRIQRHRSWLNHPPTKEPTRSDFNLPSTTILSADDRNRINEAITHIIRGWGVEDMELPSAERDVIREHMLSFWAMALKCDLSQVDDRCYALAAISLGLSSDVLYVLRQERAYRSARKQWEQYKRWEQQRNPVRAALEAKYGYDTKHGMHLIRLMRMGLEILRDQTLTIKRNDADELQAIRQGAFSYEQLLQEAQHLGEQMEAAAKQSSLPTSVDKQAIDDLLWDILLTHAKELRLS